MTPPGVDVQSERPLVLARKSLFFQITFASFHTACSDETHIDKAMTSISRVKVGLDGE